MSERVLCSRRVTTAPASKGAARAENDRVGALCEDRDVARTSRQATAGDMIRSLALILIPVVVIAIIFTNTPDDHPVKEVDWKPVLATARKEAPFEVLAPNSLPEGWRATRVTWVPLGEPYLNGEASPRNLWQIGFLSPGDVFIDLNQGDVRPQEMVDQQSRAGTPDGNSVIAGQTWQRLLSPDGRTRSLVLHGPSATTVVSADLPYEALEAYVSTLSSSG
jgi:Protein of unknown function (DUF4245)